MRPQQARGAFIRTAAHGGKVPAYNVQTAVDVPVLLNRSGTPVGLRCLLRANPSRVLILSQFPRFRSVLRAVEASKLKAGLSGQDWTNSLSEKSGRAVHGCLLWGRYRPGRACLPAGYDFPVKHSAGIFLGIRQSRLPHLSDCSVGGPSRLVRDVFSRCPQWVAGLAPTCPDQAISGVLSALRPSSSCSLGAFSFDS